MRDPEKRTSRLEIAQFRYGVVAQLFTRPPDKYELAERMREIAALLHLMPGKKKQQKFSTRTVERWYRAALKNREMPSQELITQVRKDKGSSRLTIDQQAWLKNNVQTNSNWSWKLHSDNLGATDLLPKLSYSTVLRWMKKNGYYPTYASKKKKRKFTEIRSFEVEFNNALWHADWHHGSRKVLDKNGEYRKAICIAFLDDKSRFVCHCQWYYGETAEEAIHCLKQAFQKCGLPRAIYTDNGSSYVAEEFSRGLQVFGIEDKHTIPYHPEQNGKQEHFWQVLEGRLIKMLNRVSNLTLEDLNKYTQAWVHQDYHRLKHSETGQTPLDRFLNSKSVGRESPDLEKSTRAFRSVDTRTLRKTDCTISIDGVRFEIPSQYKHLSKIMVAYARFDMSLVSMLNPDTGEDLCDIYPVDKNKNADGLRKMLEKPELLETVEDRICSQLPPLLERCLKNHAAEFPSISYMSFAKKEAL